MLVKGHLGLKHSMAQLSAVTSENAPCSTREKCGKGEKRERRAAPGFPIPPRMISETLQSCTGHIVVVLPSLLRTIAEP